jgi:predicted ATPase/DNA-binding CsgD family transcriptional regulator
MAGSTCDTRAAEAAVADRFVGRARELADLSGLLRGSRLLTLVGTAGVGKSRLARELADRIQRSYPAGVHFVELVTVTDGDQVPHAVAGAIRVTESPQDSLIRTLAAALADGKALLVLDNCEHLVESCAALVEELLRTCPRLTVLATSREVLQLPSETVYRLAGLSLPDPAGGVGDDLGSDAVRLFVDRARRATGVLPSSLEPVATVCTGLEGVPLAIELAAQLSRQLPVTELAERLDDRLPGFTAGSPPADHRHRSLFAAIEWSYDLLHPDEQVVFRRLSVLAGGFSLDAAESVCAAGTGADRSVLGTVLSLEAKSLVAPVHGQPGPARFRMMESIRLYARDRLVAHGEEAATYERLVAWLADLAEPIVWCTRMDPDLTQRLATEHDNVCHVLRRGVGHDRHLLLVCAVAGVRFRRGQFRRAIAVLGRALACGDELSRYRPLALVMAAALAEWRGDGAAQLALARDGLDLERRFNRPAMLFKANRAAARAWFVNGRIDAAVECLEECARICHLLDDADGKIDALNNLAWIALTDDQFDRPVALIDEAMQTAERHGQVPPGEVLHTAGALALERDEPSHARRCFTASLRDAGPMARDAAHPLEGLALVEARTGQPERALRLLAAAREIRRLECPTPAWNDLWWRERLDGMEATVRRSLPADRADAAMAAGRRLDRHAAVEYALEVTDRDEPDDGRPVPLGQREWQVATLVAQGLSNRQIAARLRTSVRTVEAQVRSVRVKLDLSSRAQVAAWAAERARAASGAAPALS